MAARLNGVSVMLSFDDLLAPTRVIPAYGNMRKCQTITQTTVHENIGKYVKLYS